MVCVAAFIILCLTGIFVLIISIWRPEVGKRYLKLLKKAWQCVGKRLTLQKCETNFKEDVKNSLLKKVLLTKPEFVKLMSIAIEVTAVLIVLVTAFSLVEAVKSGLALYTLGTCNVSSPDSCVLGKADTCLLEQEKLNWFQEWGVIFSNIPDRMKKWDASDYLDENSIYYREFDSGKESALDVFDPLCGKCVDSYKAQLNYGFFDQYNVALVPYAIKGDAKEYRFNHSYLLSTYLLAMHEVSLSRGKSSAWEFIKKLAEEEKAPDITWQTAFSSEDMTEEDVRSIVNIWLEDIGYDDAEIEKITALTRSEEIRDKMRENEILVEDVMKVRGVPTTIYDGKKHNGVYKSRIKNDDCTSSCS